MPQQLRIHAQLLVALAAGKLHDRWLDLYLQVLNDTALRPLITLNLDRAIRFSAPIGRQAELRSALEYLAANPTQVSEKQTILSALKSLDQRALPSDRGAIIASDAAAPAAAQFTSIRLDDSEVE